MDCSLPGVSVHEILQARILEWVAIPFSEDLPDPGIKPRSLALMWILILLRDQGRPWLRLEICKRVHTFPGWTRYSSVGQGKENFS